MRFNMGCGRRRMEGCVNVDAAPECEPDQVFDREKNVRWAARGLANTPLALYTGVDFKTVVVEMVLDEPYATQLKTGELTQAEIERMSATLNNVVSEFRVVLEARKAA